MPITQAFVTQLKSAGDQYLNHPFTKLKTVFRGSSPQSRQVALMLSHLKEKEPSALTAAVMQLRDYVTKMGARADLESLRFWQDYLVPILIQYANDPLTDVPAESYELLSQLEFQLSYRVNGVPNHLGLIFSCLGRGYDAFAAKQIDVQKTHTELELLPNHYDVSEGRTLILFFALNQHFEGLQAPAKVNHNKLAHPLLHRCLHDMGWGEELIFLKHVDPQHPSIGAFLPSLLFKLAKNYRNELPHGYRDDNDTEDTVPTRMACLQELVRLGLKDLTIGQLLSVVDHNPDYYFENMNPGDLAHAMAADERWKAVLIDNPSGPLHYTKLLNEEGRGLVSSVYKQVSKALYY